MIALVLIRGAGLSGIGLPRSPSPGQQRSYVRWRNLAFAHGSIGFIDNRCKIPISLIIRLKSF